MWSRKIWDPYLSGTHKERDHITGKLKKTYLVGYGLSKITNYGKLVEPVTRKTKHVWLLVDAYTRKDISNKYWDFTVFDTEPTWLPTYKMDNFIKGCDGDKLHLDIDKIDDISDALFKTLHKNLKGEKTSYCRG